MCAKRNLRASDDAVQATRESLARAFGLLGDTGLECQPVAYDVSVNVVFLGRMDFDPSPPLGDTGRSRYFKVRSLEEARGAGDDRVDRAGRARIGWR
jgi:hypothetical protein